jgi:hypothetical protein
MERSLSTQPLLKRAATRVLNIGRRSLIRGDWGRARSSFADSALDFPCVLHDLQRRHDLEVDHAAVVAKVDDKARTYLIAFLDPLIVQADRRRIGLRIVGHLHGIRPLIYLSICDVL